MHIIYVHHGNRKHGNPPTQEDDLTELGYKDCDLLAELLNNNHIKCKVKAIYTSTFFRCKKTAEIINKHLNVDIVEDDRLNEYKSENDENWLDLQNRVEDVINNIVNKFDNDDYVICVTSGINIVAFINKAYSLPASANAPMLGVPSCSPIIFEYKKN